jgi:hypothetical protein
MAEANTTGSGVGTGFLAEAAYLELANEINAVPEEDELPINVDLISAVTQVLGVLPELKALRPELEGELRRFDLQRFDKLEKYALALGHAHALHRSTLPEKGTVTELGNAVTALRDRLLADAHTLAGYDLLNAERLRDCKKANGYRAAAGDLFTIVTVLKEHWPKIEGKTPLTKAALDDAGNRAVELLSAVGVREQGPVDAGRAMHLRQKAFRLFVDAYEDARRAIAYIRAPYRDAEEITPSFWGPRGPRRRVEEPVASEPPLPPHPDDAKAEARELHMTNPTGLPVTKPFTDN